MTPTLDARELVAWILTELEPSVRVGREAGHYARRRGDTAIELYGVADMACVLHTIGHLQPGSAERDGWSRAFATFRDHATGQYLERDATHDPLHNTAFALAAMALLGLAPPGPVAAVEEWRDPERVEPFLASLDWERNVYADSHRGAGLASIIALTPDDRAPAWFGRFFAALDALVDPANGMLGVDKPPGGDIDQIGGTFHYDFLYDWYRRRLPHAAARIDALLGLQEPSGHWFEAFPLWVNLDATYLLTRAVRVSHHRPGDAAAAVRSLVGAVWEATMAPGVRDSVFGAELGVHSLTAAVSILAEAQLFLGGEEIVTDRPLRPVLDHRPFI